MRRKALRSTARWLLLPLLLALLAGCGRGASQGSGAASGEAPPAPSDGKGSTAGETGAEQQKPGDGKTPDSKSGDKQPEKKGELLRQTYTDEQTGLTVNTPAYWEATMKDGALVVLLSPKNGVEDLYRENIVITYDDQFENLSLIAYLKALGTEVRKRYPDTKTLESGEIEIDGIMAHWMVDGFTGTKGPAKVYRVVIIKEPAAYVFHATAPAEIFDLYHPTFEAIAKSMTWPKPEEAKQ